MSFASGESTMDLKLLTISLASSRAKAKIHIIITRVVITRVVQKFADTKNLFFEAHENFARAVDQLLL